MNCIDGGLCTCNGLNHGVRDFSNNLFCASIQLDLQRDAVKFLRDLVGVAIWELVVQSRPQFDGRGSFLLKAFAFSPWDGFEVP